MSTLSVNTRKDRRGRTHQRHPNLPRDQSRARRRSRSRRHQVEGGLAGRGATGDQDRAALKARIEAALTGAVDVLWLTDKKGRDVGVSAAKIAFVELGAAEGERRIGFGG